MTDDDVSCFEFRGDAGESVTVTATEGGYRLTLSLVVPDPDLLDTAQEEAWNLRGLAANAGRTAEAIAQADRCVTVAFGQLADELRKVPAQIREKLMYLLALKLFDRDPDDTTDQ
jgi:hypothetical protein